MVHFVGAGPGAPDLITVRGMRLLERADIIIYAGSLVNPELLHYAKEDCEIYNSAKMTLEEVIAVMEEGEKKKFEIVRLHTGDQSIYGAVREQMDVLEKKKIPYDSCPGVSACFGAAASLNLEYTLPEVSQSLIITRMEGKTKVPEKETIESFAAHQSTMAIYLSTGMLEELSRRLITGGYKHETPAVLIYKATWPEEEAYFCTVGTLAETAKVHGITKTALTIVGEVVKQSEYQRSKLYDPYFTTEFRTGKLREEAVGEDGEK
ncbi:MAG: precorrin-4 C(11)-methyltransferase [Roseburia sp.]